MAGNLSNFHIKKNYFAENIAGKDKKCWPNKGP